MCLCEGKMHSARTQLAPFKPICLIQNLVPLVLLQTLINSSSWALSPETGQHHQAASLKQGMQDIHLRLQSQIAASSTIALWCFLVDISFETQGGMVSVRAPPEVLIAPC